MAANLKLGAREVLELLPQKPPFRFLDELVEIDEDHAVGRYTFKRDETFYAGHFPGNPVTPGVILLETMAQTGLVALGIYLMSLEVPPEEVGRFLTVFTDGQFEFAELVLPGDQVLVKARKIFWRGHKLKSKVELSRIPDGTLLAHGEVAGIGVRRA